MKRFLLGTAAVLLLCTGCSGGTAKLGKSTPEKLFKMSAVELSELSSSKFKEILNEDGALYEEEYDTYFVKTPDKFMGYTCRYGAEKMDEGIFDDNGSNLTFYLDLGSGDEYKEARKKIDGYFEKNQVKGVNAMKIEEDGMHSFYTLELTDAGKDFGKRIDAEFSDEAEEKLEYVKNRWELFDKDEAKELTTENLADKIQQALSKKGYKLYKAVGVTYELASDVYNEKFVEGFDGVCCEIYLSHTILTDSEYIQYAARSGYDAIDGEIINLDDVDKKLRSAASDRELYGYYMMKEHGFNIDTGKTDEDKQAFQYWCLNELKWDDEAGENVDLSDYFSSAKVYMAAEENYNVDSGKAFGSEKELAQWLYENIRGTDKDKRMWVLSKTGYDAEAGKTIDKGVAEALYGYYQKLDGDFATPYYKLIYIDEDEIPELLFEWGHRTTDTYTYYDSSVVFLNNWDECSYYDHGNLHCESGRVSFDELIECVCKIENGQRISLFDGRITQDVTTDGVNFHDKYEISGKEVSETEYYAAYGDVFHVDGEEPVDVFMDGPGFSEDLMTAYYDSLLPIKRGEQSASETAPPETQASAQSSGEYILPDSNIRYMTYNDLKGLDADTLRIAKNEIFARHGRMFKDEKLNDYFNSKSWYNGTISPDNFSDTVFNDFENGNISIIQFFQDGTPDGDYGCIAAGYKYFKIDSGVLTVFANGTSGGGYALSLPVADDCVWSYGGYEERWQQPYTGGEAGLLSIIADERAEYEKSPDNFESPAHIDVRVKGGAVVKIWEWSS